MTGNVLDATDHRIWAGWLKSWVIEGSLDGHSWTEIHRQRVDFTFESGSEAGHRPRFGTDVSNPVECRFIRLTMPGKGDGRPICNYLIVLAVEFFGTLLE
jgi:hypothetical protein